MPRNGARARTPVRLKPITPGVRRKCDNCPKRYIPKSETHRFHCERCRKEYWRFGEVLGQLRDRLDSELDQRLLVIEARQYAVMTPEMRFTYRELWPERFKQIEAALAPVLEEASEARK